MSKDLWPEEVRTTKFKCECGNIDEMIFNYNKT
jgi:hypothetical protein